jgi:hypothetical protein
MSAWMQFAARSSVAALAAWMMLGAASARVSASPIETPVHYSTYGSVDSFGVDGQPVVVYQGVQYGTLTTGGSFSLGQFSVAATSDGGSATYTDIPFQIALRVQSLGGSAPSPNQTPAILQGTLSAVITDGKIDSLTAKFPTYPSSSDDPPPYPSSIAPFQIADYNGFLNVTSSGDGGGTIQAELNVAPVPEPTSMMVFAAAAGLVALRARRRTRS